jgi:transcriptional regulator with GAF, ATPase, and Fis domain
MKRKPKIIGHDSGLANVMERVALVASKNIPILIHGESGSGKELVAQEIHELSQRKNNIFRRVNCGAIAPELIDSELFGHEKGAFTGTSGLRRGWFEQADKGTLFLDEIGELSAAAQVRLLRVLQDGCFTRVGGEKEIKCDVRIIAATHRYLPELIENKQFREDLYYRLSVFPIVIPPLRERLIDIAELTEHFTNQAFSKYGIKPMNISQRDIMLLQEYSWPGNVREFASVINRAVLLGEVTGSLQIARALGSFEMANISTMAVKDKKGTSDSEDEMLEAVIRNHINRILTECHGRIDGPFGAAKRLGLNPSTLRSKMRKLNLLK